MGMKILVCVVAQMECWYWNIDVHSCTYMVNKHVGNITLVLCVLEPPFSLSLSSLFLPHLSFLPPSLIPFPPSSFLPPSLPPSLTTLFSPLSLFFYPFPSCLPPPSPLSSPPPTTTHTHTQVENAVEKQLKVYQDRYKQQLRVSKPYPLSTHHVCVHE